MTKGFARLLMLLAAAWVVTANFHLLGSAIEAALHVTSVVGERVKMQKCCRALRDHYVDRDELPAKPWPVIMEAFGRASRPTAGLNKDCWGTRYRFRRTDAGFAMGSAGPDRRFGTEDDVVFHQSLRAFGYQPPKK